MWQHRTPPHRGSATPAECRTDPPPLAHDARHRSRRALRLFAHHFRFGIGVDADERSRQCHRQASRNTARMRSTTGKIAERRAGGNQWPYNAHDRQLCQDNRQRNENQPFADMIEAFMRAHASQIARQTCGHQQAGDADQRVGIGRDVSRFSTSGHRLTRTVMGTDSTAAADSHGARGCAGARRG